MISVNHFETATFLELLARFELATSSSTKDALYLLSYSSILNSFLIIPIQSPIVKPEFWFFELFFQEIKIETNENAHETVGVFTCGRGHKDLNPEPTVLETAALPIELYPIYQKQMLSWWWAFRDSNLDDPVMSRRL